MLDGVLDLGNDKWDLSDTEAHLLLLHLLETSQEGKSNSNVQELAFSQYHFIFLIDLSPSCFSVATDGDYVVYDAIVASLFSVLRRLIAVKASWDRSNNSNREIGISVVGFSTVHTPNARQAFLLCAPLTEESLKLLDDKIIDYVRLLVQQYEPIAKNWLVGDTDEEVLLIPGLFESDDSEDDEEYSQGGGKKNKPTLELGTSDIAMIDQMRIAHRIAQLTVSKARTVAIFVSDGVTDLPTPAVADFLIAQFRCTCIPCCFVLPSSPDRNQKRPGLAPSSYFAHIVNRSLLELIAAGTNGVLCFASRQSSGSFDVSELFIENLLHERIPCVGCHAFDSSSPQPHLVRLPYRKVPVTVTVYPLVSARFAHGFKKCRSTRPESPTDANLCLRWHPNITIRYFISQTVLEVWLEGEPSVLNAIYPLDDGDIESGFLHNIEESVSRAVRSTRQTIAIQIGKDLFRYLQRLADIDDLIMKIYQTDTATIPADPVLRAVPTFVFLPKDRQLAAHESLRSRESGGKKANPSQGENEVEDITSFISYWRSVATLNLATLKLIYVTRNMQYFLNYDRPLPKILMTASSVGVGPAPRQTSALACRLALNNIRTYLRTAWASFELIENRAFVKFLSDPLYCIVRLSDRNSPVVNIHVSFLRGTEKKIISDVLEELSKHFDACVLASSKHTEIKTMFPLSIPLDSFAVEPNAWLTNFASSVMIPEYQTLLASIEHSQPARVRPMTNVTLLSRIYRADRVVYELYLPGGMSPRALFNKILRSFIKRKLCSGYRFSSASSSYLCFGMEVNNYDGSTIDSMLKPFIQFNLSYQVEECTPERENYQTSVNLGSSSRNNDDVNESRPHSAATTLQAPPRRFSLAVGVSSVELLRFRIVTELWILPVGVNDCGGSLENLVLETHRQDFKLICRLYSYFAFRLACIIAVSQKSSSDKNQPGFQLPPPNKWFWNPSEFFDETVQNSRVLDRLSHPVVTLSASPDLHQLLSNSQEITIRLPLLRCASTNGEKSNESNIRAAVILRDSIIQSLVERFPYRTTLNGSSKKPRDSSFISGVSSPENTYISEWSMFALTADRPEHIFFMFIPNEIESWLGSSTASTSESFVSMYLYVSVFDWFVSESREKDIRNRPADLVVDVAEDIFTGQNSSIKDQEPRTPGKRRFNSTNHDIADASVLPAPEVLETSSTADTFLLGSVQGGKLADNFASVYVSAVYQSLTEKLPICSSDFELAVSSLCTESVCSEIDLKQLLLLHGYECSAEKDCTTPGEDRLAAVILQWFEPVPCAPNYYFFKPPKASDNDSNETDSEDGSYMPPGSMSGSFNDSSWQQHYASSPEKSQFDIEPQSDSPTQSGFTATNSRTTSCNDFEDDFNLPDEDRDVNSILSEDNSTSPPPLFLHCTCSIMMKAIGDQPSSLIHIPLSTLPNCLRTLLAASDEEDRLMAKTAAELIDSLVSVTLDVICIAPNPLRLPTSVSSTPVHRNAPIITLSNAQPATDGAVKGGNSNIGLGRRNPRKRSSFAFAKESESLGYFQTLSLHSSQYLAVSALVKQFHWLVYDAMIMLIPSNDLDLSSLAAHVTDTLRVSEMSPLDSYDESSLPPFCPLVKRKRRALAFVFGIEQSQPVFAEILDGWMLKTAGAVVRRLGNCAYFYCAIPVQSQIADIHERSVLSGVLSNPGEDAVSPLMSPFPKSATSEGHVSSPIRKPGSVLLMHPRDSSSNLTLPHLRRRHQSAAPILPLRQPQISQILNQQRPRQMSSSRRQVDTASPPLGLAAPFFLSPQKSNQGNDSLSTDNSSPQSIFTGQGYESDSELTNERDEEFNYTAASPVGMHSSQTVWIFTKIGHKLCKFFLYVPWLSRNSEKGLTALALLGELVEAVDKCVRRTNQQLLLREMHSTLMASQLMLHGGDDNEAAMRSFADVPSDVKLADELSLPPEHFACPVQSTHRFDLHPSLRLGSTAQHMFHGPGRPNLMSSGGLSESIGSSTPAGRALAVIRGFLQNVAVMNRRDVFTYRQARDGVDSLYYLVFTSGQTNADDRSEVESLATSSGVDSLMGSSVIIRNAGLPLEMGKSLSRSISRLTTSSQAESTISQLSSQASSQQHWWLDMRVHGLDRPNEAELEVLVTGLQHALDKAVLQNLLSSLIKNPMHRLTPSDVDFIQHSQQPAQIFFTLPSMVANSSPQVWFIYFKQIFLAGYAHLPHFSLVPGAHLAGLDATASACRFKDTTSTPPIPLDSNNTFLFFTRMESGLDGIACVNISLLPPNETQLSTSPIDWLQVLTTSASQEIVTEHLKGFKKAEARSLNDWTLSVRVWERGTVISDLILAIERCIGSATADMIAEGVLSAVSQQINSSSSGANSVDSSSSGPVETWLQLQTFLDYVSTQLVPPAALTIKRFQVPLMRICFWLDVACKSISASAQSFMASGNTSDSSGITAAKLYMNSMFCSLTQHRPNDASQMPTTETKFTEVFLKDIRSSANSHRKLSTCHWFLFSSSMSSDWKKHNSTSSPVNATRQCFVMIHVEPKGTTCEATALLYNVIAQRADNFFSDLENSLKLSELQIKSGTDIVLQKAGLFTVQYMHSERPTTTISDMLNVLSGKPESVKQISVKHPSTRNMPPANNAKIEPWAPLPYARVVFRDQIAVPCKPKSMVQSSSGQLSDLYVDFCRQICAAAESIHRRREAVNFAGKIVQSLESHNDNDAAASALGQLQQQSQRSSVANAAKAARQRVVGNKGARRPSSHRLQAIRSSSGSVATLDSTAINILRHSCRLQHFVSAPLVLSPQWRAVAMARTGSYISQQQQPQPLPPLAVEELGLYTWFRDEYIAYIQRSLFLFELSVVNSQGPNVLAAHQPTTISQHQTSGQAQPHHTQPLFSYLSSQGGLILFQCDLRGVDLHLRLYTWERYRAPPTAVSRFAELVDRCRTMTHLHSFCYDQHVRIVQSWILDGQSVLPPQYEHAKLIPGLCNVYKRTPLFAASLICSGRFEINGLLFMTGRELVQRFLHYSNSKESGLHQLLSSVSSRYNLTVRDYKVVPANRAVPDSNGSCLLIPELVLAGRECPEVPTSIISTTLTAIVRPVVVVSDDGSYSLSENDVEVQYSLATTTKRWKELFPVETRSLRAEAIMSLRGPRAETTAADLKALALELPRYKPSSAGEEFVVAIPAAATLRSLLIACYRQGLAESQWRRITSAADVLSQSLQTGSRTEVLTSADLRALTSDISSDAKLANADVSQSASLSMETAVSMGCQVLPLSVVDSRLARLRLASPSAALAKALRNRFPLTVWLPGPPTSETRPEFTLIIHAPDRLCAVVIAWPLTEMVSSTAAASKVTSTPVSSAKQGLSASALTSPEPANMITTGSAITSPSSSAALNAKKPLLLEAAELYFLSRHRTSHPSETSLPSDSTKSNEKSTYSLYTDPNHRAFTESIINCLAADYVRQILERGTPGKS